MTKTFQNAHSDTYLRYLESYASNFFMAYQLIKCNIINDIIIHVYIEIHAEALKMSF
jgi:hypothetical protein